MWLENADLTTVEAVLLPDTWHTCKEGTLRLTDSEGFVFLADYQDGILHWISGPVSSILGVRYARSQGVPPTEHQGLR
jgi:hypothetical protein